MPVAKIVYDPARQAAALDIARNRGIYAQLATDGTWRCLDARGQAQTIAGFPDPVDALEAAEAAIVAGAARNDETNARRLLAGLNRATHVPWPRPKADGTTEWVVLKVSDRSVVGGPVGGVQAALILAANIAGQPLGSPP